MQMQNKPSEEKINQWSKFISSHLYEYDLIAFRKNVEKKAKLTTAKEATKKEERCKKMLSNLDSNDEYDASYLIDAEEIKNFNDLANCGQQNSTPLLGEDPEKSNKFEKMTNRQYLRWRLGVINDKQEKPISIKKTTGLAFLSLIGMYWFFTPKTKPSIKILMGILNLFVVATLISFIVLNLSLYFLISAAIVYGLFVLADCIHVGLKRYSEEEFGNTYNEIMKYLNQSEPPKSLIDKINDTKKKENIIKIEEKKEEESKNEIDSP